MLRWLQRLLKNPAIAAPSYDKTASRPPTGSSLQQIREALRHSEDVLYQPLRTAAGITCTLIYFDSIVDTNALNDYVIQPLRESSDIHSEAELLEALLAGAITAARVERCKTVNEAIFGIHEGQVAFLINSQRGDICMFPLTLYSERTVTESQNETVIVGPQEAFVENIQTNVSLVRHKLKHPDFHIQKFKIGTFTKTDVYLLYVEGLCKEGLLPDIRKKISNLKVPSVLGASYLAERMSDQNWSPFPTVQYSERPDTLTASLLEGRAALMIDGTPQTLIMPVTFFSLMQSAEDYYQSFLAASWIRWIRFFFVVMSFLIPSVYVAVTTFHPEMVPSNLLVTITAARENIPFPAMTEMLIMELTFEGLREAGIRIPRPLGQTVSIIGAIVIGQAAVQAGVVSAPTVIVVSITGIASFVIPHFELSLAFRLLRFPLLILGGTLGMLGVIVGLFLMYWHLVTLNSFGVPYMHPVAPLVLKDWKDVFFRIRWPDMKPRPEAFKKPKSQAEDDHA